MIHLVYTALLITSLSQKVIEAIILARQADGEVPVYRDSEKIIFERVQATDEQKGAVQRPQKR